MAAVDVLDSMINDPSINGQSVDVDSQFGGQCWDLVELFAERCGVPKATSPRPWAIPLGSTGSAKEAWTQFDSNDHMKQHFDKIPAGQQQKGDIMVYDGHGIYTEGHIAISLGGNAVFEENADPDGSVAHVYNNRNSTYLLGALRIKGGSGMSDFNEGDVVNVSNDTKIPQDQLRGKDWNGVYYGPLSGWIQQHKTEAPFNDGDQVNVANALGVDKSKVAGNWNSVAYNLLLPEIKRLQALVDSKYEPVTEQLFKKVS